MYAGNYVLKCQEFCDDGDNCKHEIKVIIVKKENPEEKSKTVIKTIFFRKLKKALDTNS